MGLLARVVMSFSLTLERAFSYGGEVFLSQRVFLSLTELTDLTELFGARFDSTERLRHTEFTERYC